MGLVDQAIEDSVSDSRFTNGIMPGSDRELTADEGRALVILVLSLIHI